MSATKLNGDHKINGTEAKAPFLIGVAGGTASGKVYNFFSNKPSTCIMKFPIDIIYFRARYVKELWRNLDK